MEHSSNNPMSAPCTTSIDNSLLLLYKPTAISSCQAVEQVKRRLRVKKAGHAGTLDPFAEGLLIVALGKATRALTDLSKQNKCYEVRARLGLRTTTGDCEGEIVERRDIMVLKPSILNDVFSDFIGEIEQTPPMYSALKHQGQRLYKLARANISVPRNKRKVEIQSLTLRQISDDGFSFRVECSKGTYIRTLVEDIAAALNTIAYTHSLKRTAIGAFDIKSAISLDCLERNPDPQSEYLISPAQVYSHFQAYVMDARSTRCFKHGRYDTRILPSKGCFRLYNEAGDFLGIGGDGKVYARFV